VARYGFLGDTQSVLSVLNTLAVNHPWPLLLIVVGIYVVRRCLDELHDRTGWRAVALLVTLVESFFILLMIMGGIRIWHIAKTWLETREFMAWLAAVGEPFTRLFAIFKINLPALLVHVGDFLADQVWPVFWQVLSQPLIWLAIAALIYGSNVMSLAELWRKSKPVAGRLPIARLPGAAARARRRERRQVRRSARESRTAPAGLRRVAEEFRSAFLGDIDDKYLPTFHAIRLVIRAGAVFLGSFVLVYAIQQILANYAGIVVNQLVGGHQVNFWIAYGPGVTLVTTLPFEPLRLCLLAVAFRRCLEIFQQRAAAAGPVAAPVLEPAI
jgi:hypothetical protein